MSPRIGIITDRVTLGDARTRHLVRLLSCLLNTHPQSVPSDVQPQVLVPVIATGPLIYNSISVNTMEGDTTTPLPTNLRNL